MSTYQNFHSRFVLHPQNLFLGYLLMVYLLLPLHERISVYGPAFDLYCSSSLISFVDNLMLCITYLMYHVSISTE